MPHHQGWPGITCGGILATLIDCHSMATAMASAVRREGRALDSEPHYRFATGSMSLRYLKPTPNDRPLVVRAHVTEVKDEPQVHARLRRLLGGREDRRGHGRRVPGLSQRLA